PVPVPQCTITAQGIVNALDGPNTPSSWILTGVNTGRLNGNVNFTSIQNLLGGVAQDVFAMAPTGSLTGTLDGGGGTNTLLGPNLNNIWNVTGSNAGKLNASVNFKNIQNVIGGSLADVVLLQTAGSLAGNLNGGAGTNTINYANYVGDVTVNLP